MSGGKGGGSTSEVTIPEYIEKAAQRNLNKAEGISQIGYTPYYGPDVAAFTPMQQAAFQNTADASSAFGMAAPTSQQDIMGGMGAPTTYANGVSGYSSQPMFEESLAELGRQRPGQKDYIDSFFIDPFTGQAGSRVSAPVNYENYMTAAESGRREADANRANELAIANAAYKGPSSVFYNNEDTVMNTTGIGGGASASGGSSASFDSPSDTGSYGGSLMTGGPTEATGNVSVYDPGMIITNPISGNTSTGGYVFDPTDYNSDYGSGPAPTGSTTPAASDGGFISIGDMFDGGGAGKSGDTFEGGGLISDVGNAVTGSNDDDNNSGGGGGGGGFCFLTTAIVEKRGEADDGPTLSKLRNFRDTYMSSDPKMAENIKEYYNVAPKIVASIPEDHEDWDWIGQQVDKSVEHIDANEMGEAYDVYSNMVSRLMSNWVEKKEAF
jgi:hypothetical protein